MTPGSAGPPLDVLVIGGGQASLAMGYHLKQRRLSFQIADAGGISRDASCTHAASRPHPASTCSA